jgi:hypothetical protein
MIYELRTYEAAPGQLTALNEQFRDHTAPIFERLGMKVVGYWTYAHGGWSDQLVYMMAFDDLPDREQKWATFYADPEWQAGLPARSAKPLVTRIRSDFLRPTEYSPLP